MMFLTCCLKVPSLLPMANLLQANSKPGRPASSGPGCQSPAAVNAVAKAPTSLSLSDFSSFSLETPSSIRASFLWNRVGHLALGACFSIASHCSKGVRGVSDSSPYRLLQPPSLWNATGCRAKDLLLMSSLRVASDTRALICSSSANERSPTADRRIPDTSCQGKSAIPARATSSHPALLSRLLTAPKSPITRQNEG